MYGHGATNVFTFHDLMLENTQANDASTTSDFLGSWYSWL